MLVQAEREHRAHSIERAIGAKPEVLAHQRLLPVVPAIAELLPDGGLRRGSTVAVVGSTSLLLALAAGASAAGSWCAVVGEPDLGLVAASELGVALERFPLIAASGRAWTRTVAAVLEACDVVLARPSKGVPGAEAHRLSAVARERGAVLVLSTTTWPGRTDLRLEAVGSGWVGVERGHGRLRARRLVVEVTGRGAASVLRRHALWLPAVDGRIVRAEDPRGIAVVEPATRTRAAG